MYKHFKNHKLKEIIEEEDYNFDNHKTDFILYK